VKTMKPVKWLAISSNRNSRSGSINDIRQLNFKAFWADHSFGHFYIHVPHKSDGTVHRVWCKISDQPRIGFKNGKHYWLVP
jgi:hypothetical protein